MDSWKESIETWLLDCSGAIGVASPLPNGDGNLVENGLEDLTDALTQQQREQLTAACSMQNDKLFRALFTLFEEKTRHLDLYDKVLKQMFVLARCEVSQVRQFALQFSPALIYLDLHALAHSDSKSVYSIELVLLALYNAEVLDDAGQYRIPSYRVPTLARPSCYHDPSSLGQPSFTPDSLVRLENLDRTLPALPPVSPLMYAPGGQNGANRQDNHTAITDGSNTVNGNHQLPNYHLATITASTRSAVLSSVMAAFNAVIVSLQPIVLVFLCKFISRLVTQGLPKGSTHQKRSSYSESSSSGGVTRGLNSRYSVQADLLLQLLLAAYSAVHNLRGDDSSGCGDVSTTPSQFVATRNTHKRHKLSNAECMCVAIQAIEDIQMRSECDLLPELLHLSYAITHSLKHNNIINGEASDSPSLSSAVPPPPSTPLSKTFITNASFRTKKLPEDIPVQPSLDTNRATQSASDSSSSSKVLVSISEEENEGDLKRDAKENMSGRSLASIASEKTSSKFTSTKFSPSNLAIPGLKRKEKDKNKSLDKKDSHGDLLKKQRNGKGEEERQRNGKEQEQIQQLMEMKIIGTSKSENKNKSGEEAESSSLSDSLSSCSVEATDKM